MANSIPDDELAVFLPEFKDLISKLEEISAELTGPDSIVEKAEDFFTTANSLVGITEFTDSKPLIDLSNLLVQFFSGIMEGTIEWSAGYVGTINNTIGALKRIRQLIENKEFDKISEDAVISELRGIVSVNEEDGDQLGGMDEDELEIFIDELSEYVGIFANTYNELAQGNYDGEVFFDGYKSTHTIKGFAAIIKFEELRALAAELEKLMQALKDGRITVQDSVLRVAEPARDLLFSMLDDVLENKRSAYDIVDLLQSIKDIYEDKQATSGPAPESAVEEEFSIEPISISEGTQSRAVELLRNGGSLYDIIAVFHKDTDMKAVRCFQFMGALNDSGVILESVPNENEIMVENRVNSGVKYVYYTNSIEDKEIVAKFNEIEDLQLLNVSRREV